MLRLDSKENGWIHFYLLRIYWVDGFVCVCGVGWVERGCLFFYHLHHIYCFPWKCSIE